MVERGQTTHESLSPELRALADIAHLSGSGLTIASDIVVGNISGQAATLGSVDSVYATVGIGGLADSGGIVSTKGVAAPMAIFEHRESNNTAGGGTTSGSWQKAKLNYEKKNTIAGCSINTGTYVITLPAGEYWISGFRNIYRSGKSQARIVDTTGSQYIYGSSEYNPNEANMPGIHSLFSDALVLTEESTIESQYHVQSDKATDGLGVAVGASGSAPEVYANVVIIKLG